MEIMRVRLSLGDRFLDINTHKILKIIQIRMQIHTLIVNYWD